MKTIVVARKLNERRQRPNPTITTGEMIGSIGSVGMQEAIQRNWLVPDFDTGYLMVNTNAGKLAEVVEACKCKDCGKEDCDCKCKDCGKSHGDCECNESVKTRQMPKSMREAWEAPGVGNGIGSASNSTIQGQKPIIPNPPPAPATPTAPATQKPQVGSQVAAVETQNGKEKLYQGTVSGIGPDGMYRLDFGNGERPPMDREYGADQLRLVQPTHA